MSIQKDISELVKAEVISEEIANRIKEFYNAKEARGSNRLFTIFAIFGSILVGLGLVLIIAHNWDEYSNNLKIGFAFLPLLVGQLACLFVIAKKYDITLWRDSSSTFLFFAIGGCISLISQIYHIPGDLRTFLFTWMLLCVPLIYMMKSSIVSILYLIGITTYACEIAYWHYPSSEPYYYWMFLLLMLPHYYDLYNKFPHGNFIVFHHWIIPISLIISLGTVAQSSGELMFVAYVSVFGLFHIIGDFDFFRGQKRGRNGYKILGSLGTIVVLIILSFEWFWKDLREKEYFIKDLSVAPELYVTCIITLLTLIVFYKLQKNKSFSGINPISVVFILYPGVFAIGLYSELSIVLINLIVFSIGIYMVRTGSKINHLGILNYGLLIIVALVVCRFFDSDLSFVFRGVLFLLVGTGFFLTNYWMLKKRKNK